MAETEDTKVSERIETLLKQIIEHFDIEDRAVRERQVRQWRQLKLYWDGFQRVWYSQVAHDWRVWGAQQTDELASEQEYYDKPVNIYRAYLESIIAALSITIPGVKCAPDDAENALDMMTAKAGDKIAELIYKHNDVSLLWLHALFVYCTEGLVGCYNYTKEDEDYGTVKVDKYDTVDEEVDNYYCPECASKMNPDEFDPQTNNPVQ